MRRMQLYVDGIEQVSSLGFERESQKRMQMKAPERVERLSSSAPVNGHRMHRRDWQHRTPQFGRLTCSSLDQRGIVNVEPDKHEDHGE